MSPSKDVTEDPLYERARVVSKIKQEFTIEWCIHFIREWEQVTNMIKRRFK